MPQSVVEEFEWVVFSLDRPPEMRVSVSVSFALHMKDRMERNILFALSGQNGFVRPDTKSRMNWLHLPCWEGRGFCGMDKRYKEGSNQEKMKTRR